MLIILNNEFSQVFQHDAHVLQDIVVRRAENPQSKFFQTSVTACVIVHLLVVGAEMMRVSAQQTKCKKIKFGDDRC